METIQSITTVQWYGIILMAAGLIVRYILGLRKYNRIRNWCTLPMPPFYMALFVGVMEWLFTWAANVGMMYGLFLILIEWYNGY